MASRKDRIRAEAESFLAWVDETPLEPAEPSAEEADEETPAAPALTALAGTARAESEARGTAMSADPL